MRNPLLVVSLVLLLCFAFGCPKQGKEVAKAPEVNVEADVAAIQALLDEWAQLYNAGDFDRLVSTFYAENAVVISPDKPVRKGKEAILLEYKKEDEFYKLNKEHVDSSVAQEVRVSGNLAAAWGIDADTSTPRSGGEPVKYTVNWLMAFERQPDGTWKCLYEMWDDLPRPETREKEELD